MANTTFSGPVRSKGGFNVINENSTTGAITQTGFSVNSTGQLISLGSRKIQTKFSCEPRDAREKLCKFRF